MIAFEKARNRSLKSIGNVLWSAAIVTVTISEILPHREFGVIEKSMEVYARSGRLQINLAIGRKNAMSMENAILRVVANPIFIAKLECGTMPNVMAALPNIGGALCSTPQFG